MNQISSLIICLGLGAILFQMKEDGKEHVISCTSRSMNKAEESYPITDQQSLNYDFECSIFESLQILNLFCISLSIDLQDSMNIITIIHFLNK